MPKVPKGPKPRGRSCSCLLALLLALAACLACAFFPYRSYLTCGDTQPTALPASVTVGLYEEFPTPERLDKLTLADFPVTLAVAAHSRAEFLQLRDQIFETYPNVAAVYFWPLLTPEEGYYPGPFSATTGLQRAVTDAQGLPTLWDLEWPRAPTAPAWDDWLRNRDYLDQWLAQRDTPVHIWRTYAFLGLDPLLLRAAGLHFDPTEYPQVWLHLDLYSKGDGLPPELTARILRCGVERYGDHFIPSFGVLNDGQAPADQFVTPAALQRDLALARQAGVSQVWLFGVNGLNAEYVAAVRAGLGLP